MSATQTIVEPIEFSQREPAPPVPTAALTAEKVPEAHRPQPVQLVRLIIPIVMVMAMVGMVGLMVLGAGGRQLNPMMLVFPIMMLASVALMFNPTGGAEDPDEVRRTYLRHIAALREDALAHAAAQRAHQLHWHPDPASLGAVVLSAVLGHGPYRLWERASGDADVLEIRIGLGKAALATPISVPDSGAAEDLDPVCAVSLRRMVAAVDTVSDMPVVVGLRAFRFIGLSGAGARAMARAMVLQLAVAHGPETVGIRVVASESAEPPQWTWVKWLPHARQPQAARYQVVIVDGVDTTGLEDFMEDPAVTTIIDVGTRRTTALGIRAEAEGLSLHVEQQLRVITAAGEEELGIGDDIALATADATARLLARCRRPAGSRSLSRRSDGDLVDLLGFADVAQLTGDQMWPGREASARLKVPIGIDSQGQGVFLDLKESAHGGMGPHGLCIGATGSGKSELLKSLVTALVATHSPEELNLVLVDFKGGATFLGCENLPHTAAVITNLENEAILVERMFDAISGEMNRRQEVLRQAGNFANVTDYNAARQAHRPELAPLPALLIVVDEFSELLGQHPDFADLFVAVGRLGRSLHVHLLLASQRLEEGRLRGLDSHLSYRIGLKTFSAAESRQVLGVPDAYQLPAQPGAGYLKTTTDEVIRFQGSYVSGPLRRTDTSAATELALDSAPGSGRWPSGVEFFLGWEDYADAAGDHQHGQPDDSLAHRRWLDESTTLLDTIVAASATAGAQRGMQAHQIWLDPLPPVIELSALAQPPFAVPAGHGSSYQVSIGIIDRPYHQRQDPLRVDLDSGGGHIAVVGGPQSGKSMALATITAALAAHCPPGTGDGEIKIYVIDLGGGQLATLERLPHVAGVAARDNPEKVRRVIAEVTQELSAERRRGRIVLVIDGWHHIGTAAAEFEDLAEAITVLAADGPSQGIHLVLSSPRWTALRPAVRDLMATRIELRLGEALDSVIDRKAQQKLPTAPGRGLSAAAEFMLVALTSNQDLAHISSLWSAKEQVEPLRMLPDYFSAQHLPPASLTDIYFGIGGPRLEPAAWQPAANPHFVVVGAAGSGKSTVLDTLMRAVASFPRTSARLVIIDPRRAHLGTQDPTMVAAYAATSSATETVVRDITATMTARLPGPDITAERLAARDWWDGPEIFVVIDDSDLVSEIALAPLVPLLPHARDIGLHLIVARKAGGFSRALFGQFFAGLRDGQAAALVLDADRDEGVIFGIKATRQPPGRGQFSRKGASEGTYHCASHRPDNEEQQA